MSATSSRLFSPVAVGVLAIGVLATFVSCQTSGSGSVAPTPAVFNDAPASLDDAIARAAREDKVVVAVTTADWCGPCQAYKRSALVDARVVSWLATNAVPVYINADKSPDDALTLGVRGLPTTTILRDGEIVASGDGNMPADQLLELLASAG